MSTSYQSVSDLKILNEIGHLEPLTTEEEWALAERIQATGDPEAIDKLVSHNIKWCAVVANRWKRQKDNNLDDLMSEAMMGMIRAAKTYKPGRARFISYADHWVRSHCQRWVVGSDRVVTLPQNTYEHVRLATKYEAKTGKNAEEEEPSKVRGLIGIPADRYPNSAREIVAQTRRRPVSMNRPLGGGDDEDSDTMQDTLVCDAPPPSFKAEHDALSEALRRALSDLPDRHRVALEMRFLSEHSAIETLGERAKWTSETASLPVIAKHFGVSRERARQIINEALEYLRERNPDLADFL